MAGAALGAFLLWPRTRPRARKALVAGARELVALERSRRTRFFGDAFPEYRPEDQAVLRYLAAGAGAGLLCAVVAGLLVFGVLLAVLLARGVVRASVS
ncbi:hypothetical protein ACFYNV_30080 [Streptomyces albidoflavus]